MKGNLENEPYFENAIKKLNCSLENIIEFKLTIEKDSPKLFPRKYNIIKNKPL